MGTRILAILVLGLFLLCFPAYADKATQFGLNNVADALQALALGVFGAGLAVMIGLFRVARALAQKGTLQEP